MKCYMLVTFWPLYSSKSFHDTIEDVMERIDFILEMTDLYYTARDAEFKYDVNYDSGEYPGVSVFKIYPEKMQKKSLVGIERKPTLEIKDDLAPSGPLPSRESEDSPRDNRDGNECSV